MKYNKYFKYKLLIVFTCIYTFLYSQVLIEGVIVSKEEGYPVVNARVALLDTANQNIISYTFSDSNGSFSLSQKSLVFPCKLTVSSLGYNTYTSILSTPPAGSLVIELYAAKTALREVRVIAPVVSLKGDTLNYLISGFAREGDTAIEEVLKRIPGIEVTESGQIKYNDKPINALYIDGKNILEGQYSIATKNIAPDIVSMIQVFENHQPVKALKDFTPSESAAINLTLTPESKANWLGNADIAAGAPLLSAESRVLLFRFAPKVQTMNVFKANNIGKAADVDLITHSLGAAAQTQLLIKDVNYVNVTGVLVPDVGQSRSLFNKSGYISSNSMFNTSGEGQISVRTGYSYERHKLEQQEFVEYFTDGLSSVVLGERSNFTGKTHRPQLDVVYKCNSAERFFQNRINFSGRFQNNESVTTGNGTLYSSAALNQFQLSELAAYIKPFDRSLLSLKTNTSLSMLPQSLTINNIDEVNQMFQEVNLFQVTSENELSFIKRSNFFTAQLSGGANFLYQKLNSVSLFFTELYLTPGFLTERKKMRLNIKVPVKLYNGLLRVVPDVNLRYKFSSYWEGWAIYGGSSSFSDIMESYPGTIMLNYRLFEKSSGEIYESKRLFALLRATYNNPLKLVNVSASVNIARNKQDITYHYFYPGNYVLREKVGDNSVSGSSGGSLNFKKSFFGIPLLLDISASYSNSETNIVQSGTPVELIFERFSFVCKADYSFSNGVDVSLRFPYYVTTSKSLNGFNTSVSLISFAPSVNSVVKLSRDITVSLNSSFYFNQAESGNFYLYPFADVSVKYKRKYGHLFAEATNIFDNREYRYKVAGDLYISERLFTLRPFGLLAGFSFNL